jgi:hypothetical protein
MRSVTSDRTVRQPPLRLKRWSHALDAVGRKAFIPSRREFSARRRAVIAASLELQEREALKGLSLTAAMTSALKRRGVPDLASCVAAELGALALKIAYERWSDQPTTTTSAKSHGGHSAKCKQPMPSAETNGPPNRTLSPHSSTPSPAPLARTRRHRRSSARSLRPSGFSGSRCRLEESQGLDQSYDGSDRLGLSLLDAADPSWGGWCSPGLLTSV